MAEQLNTINSNELTLVDSLKFLRNGWKVLAISIFLSVCLGAVYAFFSQEKFQAIATMQMASTQGGEASQGTEGTQTILLEKPNNLVEKLKLPLFYSEKTIEECQLKNHKSPNEFLSKTVKSSLVKNTTYVSIIYIDTASLKANKCLSAVVEDIKNDQAKIVKPILDYRKSQLDLLKSQLSQTTTLNSKSTFFYSQQTLTNEIDKLSLQLATIKNAALLTPIFTPPNRVEPTPTQILLIFLLLGIFIGLIILKIKKVFN